MDRTLHEISYLPALVTATALCLLLLFRHDNLHQGGLSYSFWLRYWPPHKYSVCASFFPSDGVVNNFEASGICRQAAARIDLPKWIHLRLFCGRVCGTAQLSVCVRPSELAAPLPWKQWHQTWQDNHIQINRKLAAMWPSRRASGLELQR